MSGIDLEQNGSSFSDLMYKWKFKEDDWLVNIVLGNPNIRFRIFRLKSYNSQEINNIIYDIYKDVKKHRMKLELNSKEFIEKKKYLTDPSNSDKIQISLEDEYTLKYLIEMYKLYEDTNAKAPMLGFADDNSLQTPLMFSGISSKAFNEYSSVFKKSGFYPMQAGGSVSDTNQASKFLFGDSVAIVLADGDISLAGIGTVSHTDDEKFLLFGHSMWSKGRIIAPVSRAYINHIVASVSSSFKLGYAYSNYLGYTVYDGAFGVSGVYGEVPENVMVPVKVEIEDQTFLTRDFNFRVLNDPAYFSDILSMAIYSAVSSAAGENEEGVFSISYLKML